jgi:hypothetical protein
MELDLQVYLVSWCTAVLNGIDLATRIQGFDTEIEKNLELKNVLFFY